jgi:hypothetical protein
LDYTLQSRELTSVEFTAAAEDNAQLQAVDATSASFSQSELTAVGTPKQVATRIPNRKRVVFWLCEKRRRSDELMTQPLFLMRSGCVKKGMAILEYGR